MVLPKNSFAPLIGIFYGVLGDVYSRKYRTDVKRYYLNRRECFYQVNRNNYLEFIRKTKFI